MCLNLAPCPRPRRTAAAADPACPCPPAAARAPSPRAQGLQLPDRRPASDMAASRGFSPAVRALIAESARLTFGNLPVVNYRTGFKYLKQKPTGPMAVNYYVPDGARGFRQFAPDFLTEQEERRQDALVRLRRRGKGPTKKGEGKRAKKKK